jgi:hypothetical protein
MVPIARLGRLQQGETEFTLGGSHVLSLEPTPSLEIDFVPTDGIRLPFFLEAETSERRRFLGST